MDILLVGADRKLLHEIEKSLSRRFDAAKITGAIALNHAIASTLKNNFDVIINALPVSVDDGVQLSEAFRSTCSNHFTPVILYSGDAKTNGSLNPQSFLPNQPIYVTTDIGELIYIVQSIMEPSGELAFVA